jgi:hypothetical protein
MTEPNTTTDNKSQTSGAGSLQWRAATKNWKVAFARTPDSAGAAPASAKTSSK